MAEIVNLRNIRKRKTRDENARKADENRALYGRTKSEKLLGKAQAKRDAALLDAHQRQRITAFPSQDNTTASDDGAE